jgi:chitinase
MQKYISKKILITILVLSCFTMMFMPGRIEGKELFDNAFPKIVGYVTYDLDPAVKLKQLTSVIWEGVTPKSSDNMTLKRIDDGHISDCVAVINSCHAAGIPCVLSVYAPWDQPAYNNAFMSVNSKRHLINNIVNLIRQYGFDGVDMDWECDNDPGLSANTYAQFYADLYTQIHWMGKTIGITENYGKVTLPTYAQNYLDTISLMDYDIGPSQTWYGTMSDVQTDMNSWVKAGFSKSKLILGINFAARYQTGDGWFSWEYVVDTYNPSPSSTTADNLCFNGINLTIKKAKWVIDNRFGGVFCYEVNLDKMNDDRSLLRNIYLTYLRSDERFGNSPPHCPWNFHDLLNFRPFRLLGLK